MRLSVRHATHYAYAPAAAGAALRMKLFPPAFEGQNAAQWAVRVNGEEIAPLFTNARGEGEAIWTVREPQADIEIVAEGVVDTAETSGIVRGLADRTRPAMYLRESPLTTADEAMRALGESARRPDALATLHALNAAVADAIAYTQDSTAHNTSAAEALKQGAGVCQDHAHVFIAAARCLDLPARYVAGYLTPDFEGAHETHAWAEAYAPGLGWVGFDPSNRQCPTEAYIRLCTGYDAADAAPVRGCVLTGVTETLRVQLEVAQQ